MWSCLFLLENGPTSALPAGLQQILALHNANEHCQACRIPARQHFLQALWHVLQQCMNELSCIQPSMVCMELAQICRGRTSDNSIPGQLPCFPGLICRPGFRRLGNASLAWGRMPVASTDEARVLPSAVSSTELPMHLPAI